MQITVVVTLCHTLAAILTPVCKEASVYTGDMSMNACAISQAAIADWKSRSIFRNEMRLARVCPERQRTLMPCAACERRRKEMAIMLKATQLWTSNPTGPNVREIYLRLREEAIAAGEFDDGAIRPGS